MSLCPDENNWRNLGNPKVCQFCKGALCCQHNACTTAPTDFDKDICKMHHALLSGNYSVDLFRSTGSFKIQGNVVSFDFEKIRQNQGEGLFIRAKNVGYPTIDIIHKTDQEGPCVFWSFDKGCKLSYEDRPKFGRTLIPMPLGQCTDYYDRFSPDGLKQQIVKEWKPYHYFLMSMLYEFAEVGKIYDLRGMPIRII